VPRLQALRPRLQLLLANAPNAPPLDEANPLALLRGINELVEHLVVQSAPSLPELAPSSSGWSSGSASPGGAPSDGAAKLSSVTEAGAAALEYSRRLYANVLGW
jgi:hypothetical protein